MKLLSTRRRFWLIGALAILVVGAVVAWMMLPPRALSFAGDHAVALSDYTGPSPIGVPAELRSTDLVTRGKYLTQAADCKVCHTTEGGQPFAGGLAFATPFGVLYSPNITADRETGIGAWTDADFLNAVHKGIDNEGRRLYPAFPYESYTLLAEDDVRAIKAYLFSLPVAHATPPPNTLKFPFNQRWLMGIWSAFYNPDQRFRPLENRSPGWSGVGELTSYATLTGNRAVNDTSAINLAQIVISGGHSTMDGALLMPAFGAAYSDTEIAAVANYVTARFGAAPSRLTAKNIADFRRLSSR
jgi:mono/diheme cytochrome c family protein